MARAWVHLDVVCYAVPAELPPERLARPGGEIVLRIRRNHGTKALHHRQRTGVRGVKRGDHLEAGHAHARAKLAPVENPIAPIRLASTSGCLARNVSEAFRSAIPYRFTEPRNVP